MIGDNERSEIEKIMRESPEHARTAKAVYDAWPSVRDSVCEAFLETLQSRIRRDGPPGITVRIEERRILVSKKAWPDVQTNSDKTAGPIAVCLGAQGKGYSGWYFGVEWPVARTDLPPKGQGDFDKIKIIKSELERSKTADDQWPVYRYLRGDGYKRFNDWGNLLPELITECKSAGEISDYFAAEFDKVWSVAYPVIDAICGVER